MLEKKIIDATGDQCPIPVIKTINAIENMNCGIVEVKVDNYVAVQNILRMASGKNLTAKSQKINDNTFVVTISVEKNNKSEEDNTKEDTLSQNSDNILKGTIISVGSETMGNGEGKLGKTLLKGFIYSLAHSEKIPETIIFYNGGANLPIKGSDFIEDLKLLESKGTEILTCGTCLDFYGIKDSLAIGSITNMYCIEKKLLEAVKVIKP